MAFVEDTATFLSDFGIDAVIDCAPVRGIFDGAYQGGFGGLVAETNKSFVCQSENVPDVAVGDDVVIDDVYYKAVSIEPDGTGMTRIVLK